MLEVKNLCKAYGKRRVVDQLSFSVEEGHIFALLGSNGAGKSTTIKIILGLVRKDAGEILYPKECQIGYSPETPYFPPHLTGAEVLKYYGRLQKIEPHRLGQQIHELMEKTGLMEDNVKVRHYSKGMLQRLALAQALLGQPQILILDEPCAGLDAVGRIEMLKLIRQLKNEGKTIVMNSHILSDIEQVCDEGIIIRNGKMVRAFAKKDFAETKLEALFREALGLNICEEGNGNAYDC